MRKIEIQFIDCSREKEIETFLETWNNSEDFIAVNTSGSTGKSKSMLVSKKNMELSAKKTLNFFKIKKGSSALLCLSLDTIAGKMMLLRSLIGKLNLNIGTISLDPISKLKNPIDFVALVPLQLEAALNSNPEKLKKINTILVGGAPVSQKLIQKLQQHKLSVYQSYGMTETISHVAIRKIGFETELYYTALKGITFSHENQRLVIHYPEILNQKLLTNDCIDLIDATHFKYIGRYDFIINSGGIKINPEELELKISGLFEDPFFIWFLPDHRLGQKIVLIIESKNQFNFKKSTFKNLLSKFEIPKLYVTIANFTWTKSTKINRKKTMDTIKSENWIGIA
jgi:o-succinylbenzoate---CoA ligase